MKKSFPLYKFLQSIEPDNGFHLSDHWVWDGSIIQDEDGQWHMFASRWPKSLAMHPGWLFGSEVVRAVADTPTGPYTFQEVVFPRRDPGFFDGRMTHNPSIRKCGDEYLLFYIGCSWFSEISLEDNKFTRESDAWFHDPWTREVYSSMRIGLARSPSLTGPWERLDEPILSAAPGGWDKGSIVNPSPFVMDNGEIYMAYASSHPVGITDVACSNIGIAHAPHSRAPFSRISTVPALPMPAGEEYWFEDPFLWYADGSFHMIMKDMKQSKSFEQDAGIYAYSSGAKTWHWGDPPEAYSKTVQMGTSQQALGQVERPQLVLQDGTPRFFTAACAHSGGMLTGVTDTWVRVFPCSTEETAC